MYSPGVGSSPKGRGDVHHAITHHPTGTYVGVIRAVRPRGPPVLGRSLSAASAGPDLLPTHGVDHVSVLDDGTVFCWLAQS